MKKEVLIKSKTRIKAHGEVFTPSAIIKKMIAIPELRPSLLDVNTKVLEPSAGEGYFLMEILRQRLKLISTKQPTNQKYYENYSLLALSTLYGIELLHDNASVCVMNLYQTFYENYREFAGNLKKEMNKNVLASARTIISANIVQGNFLTKLKSDGQIIVFSDWQVITSKSSGSNVTVERKEYDFIDIKKAVANGEHPKEIDSNYSQMNVFDFIQKEPSEKYEHEIKYRYKQINITLVFREEMEEYSE